MKIKSIEWGEPLEIFGTTTYQAEYPFGFLLTVRKVKPFEHIVEWKWTIRKNTGVVAYGRAKTFEEAKWAIQKKWNEIIAQFLEKVVDTKIHIVRNRVTFSDDNGINVKCFYDYDEALDHAISIVGNKGINYTDVKTYDCH